MEDMARLALLEHTVRDTEKFSEILQELLLHISSVLENPHDYEIRTIKNDYLKSILKYEVFTDYLKSIGFISKDNELTYPKEQTLSNLRIAKAAIERKIYFCCGPRNSRILKSSNQLQVKKSQLKPSKALTTSNHFLKKIEESFNDVLKYEDEELQEVARQHIPVVNLQLKAIERVREHQKKIKAGDIKGTDLPYDKAMLMELVGWFKNKFFSWVDKPDCDSCGATTMFIKTDTMRTETETCRLEIYRCPECNKTAKFPRYNDVRTLLRTRRGRCGEWTNCFALLCRAMGYDTRYVYDTNDHVWCEVFDYETNSWMHVDPCEGAINSPLMYCHGWKKKLSYVIGVSRDDLQDVTWRYTMDHKEVLNRRKECEESELIAAIMALREHRQRQVTEARRKYLARRALEEMVQLMVERKPTDFEGQGRISGSIEWRESRGETHGKGHVFELSEAGIYTIQYYAASDLYKVQRDGLDSTVLRQWSQGVFMAKNVIRKVENDWRKVYLAREEGAPNGSVSWKIAATGEGVRFTSLAVKASSALYEDGRVEWTVTFDDKEPLSVILGESAKELKTEFRSVIVTAHLAGGLGALAWQHAQLFRQDLQANTCSMELLATLQRN